MWILDVVCNKSYFGEVQEDVLGRCTEQSIYAPRAEVLSFYQYSATEKKQAWWLMKCPFKYSPKVMFLLEIPENSKVIASELL